MIAIVQETLGNIRGMDTAFLDLPPSGKDALMHTDPVIGEIIIRL